LRLENATQGNERLRQVFLFPDAGLSHHLARLALAELHLDNFNAFFPQAFGELRCRPLVCDQPCEFDQMGPILETLLRPSLLKSATSVYFFSPSGSSRF